MELTLCQKENGQTKWTKFESLKGKPSNSDVRKLLQNIHRIEGPDSVDIMKIKEIMPKLVHERIDQDLNEEEIVHQFKNCFPLFGLPAAFKKFQTKEPLLSWEESTIIKFADRFVTVSINEAFIASKTELPETSGNVKDIVEMCNTHRCTKSCFKYADGVCRYVF